MLKKFPAWDKTKYILVIPPVAYALYRYLQDKGPVLLGGFIIYCLAWIAFEAYCRKGKNYKENSGSDAAKLEKELASREEELLLAHNQTRILNSELKNSMDILVNARNELKNKDEELGVLREVSHVISSTFDIKSIVEYIYTVFNRFTGCDRYAIYFLDKEINKLVCKYEYGNTTYNDVGYIIGEDPGTISNCFNTKQTVVRINVLLKDRASHGDEIAFPLNVKGDLAGVIYIENNFPGAFLITNLKFLESISNYFAVALKNAELFNGIYCQKQEIEALYEETAAVNDELNTYIEDLNKAKEELKVKNRDLVRFYDEMQTGYLQTVMALSNSIEAKDPYTRGHCQRVMEISCEIASRMGFNDNDIEDLRYAAILHDIGKIGVPAEILNKIGKLSDEEFNEIKKHPLIAYSILKDVDFLKNGLDAILQHHERFDGKGYPYGLKGEELGVFGKILCIADAFDAMTSDRPYRKGMAMEDAVNEIRRCKGTQFDPHISEIFIKMSEEIVSEGAGLKN